MANTSAQLLNYLGTKADIAYATQQQIYWADKYEANNKRLQKYTKYEESWNQAYDKCFDAEDGKEVKIGNVIYQENCECSAKAYADAKVEQHNQEILDELAELDIEYETMKLMWEADLEVKKNRAEAEKTNLSAAAQDTGLINS